MFEQGHALWDHLDDGGYALSTKGTSRDDPPAGELSDSVKLVVWDLDDTLWAGTLSEGPVTIDQSTVDLVRALNARGDRELDLLEER